MAAAETVLSVQQERQKQGREWKANPIHHRNRKDSQTVEQRIFPASFVVRWKNFCPSVGRLILHPIFELFLFVCSFDRRCFASSTP